MHSFNISPFLRPTAGFESIGNVFDQFDRSLNDVSYPSYDIIKKDEDHFQIVIAAVGYSDEDVDISVTKNALTITAKQPEISEEVEYLHRGLAKGSFERRFELADTIKVVDAVMDNGLLKIDLQREVPEELKPRSIKIKKPGLIENEAA